MRQAGEAFRCLFRSFKGALATCKPKPYPQRSGGSQVAELNDMALHEAANLTYSPRSLRKSWALGSAATVEGDCSC